MRVPLPLPLAPSPADARPVFTDPVAAFDAILGVRLAAEDTGFDRIWAPHHFMPSGPPVDYVCQVWATLTALAREKRHHGRARISMPLARLMPTTEVGHASAQQLTSLNAVCGGSTNGFWVPFQLACWVSWTDTGLPAWSVPFRLMVPWKTAFLLLPEPPNQSVR